MHGLINMALQGFVVRTYGQAAWDNLRELARLPFEEFEAMLVYDPWLTDAVIDAASVQFQTTRASFLEDVGTWIVAGPGQERIRRLLRFGGSDFRAFLDSVEEVPGRARMALPPLTLPEVELTRLSPRLYRLDVACRAPVLAHMIAGALRALADDYGALVVIECEADAGGHAAIQIELLDNCYAEGRSFSLGKVGA
ncbi:heme NO-binding protein [Rhodobacterales bacterium HKCCE3408]|nr:heme NO-binding protein [Rhodobacterales bacterium HKCCE3408]